MPTVPKISAPEIAVSYDKDMHPQRAEELAREGYQNLQIAVDFGILSNELEMWRHRHPNLDEAILRGRSECNEQMVPDLKMALYKKAMTGNVGALTFLLKNLAPEDYKEKQVHEITSGTPDDYAKSMRDEWERLEAEKQTAAALPPPLRIQVKRDEAAEEEPPGRWDAAKRDA